MKKEIREEWKRENREKETYGGLRLAFTNAFQYWLRGSFEIAFINAFMNGFD